MSLCAPGKMVKLLTKMFETIDMKTFNEEFWTTDTRYNMTWHGNKNKSMTSTKGLKQFLKDFPWLNDTELENFNKNNKFIELLNYWITWIGKRFDVRLFREKIHFKTKYISCKRFGLASTSHHQ